MDFIIGIGIIASIFALSVWFRIKFDKFSDFISHWEDGEPLNE